MLSGDRHDDQPDSVLFRYLRTWQRWLVGLLALLMLGFSPYAILLGHDGLATSTFVLAGLVVAAVAVTGVVPRRITYKDATIDFMVQQRVQREVQVAVEEVADEVADSTDWASLEERIAAHNADLLATTLSDPWATTPSDAWATTPSDPWAPRTSVEVFSRRLMLVRRFEDDSLAALQDYAQTRNLEVRESDRSSDLDCYLTDPSRGFEIPVVFKYSWSNDSIGRMTRFSMPRVLFICSQVPTRAEIDRLRNERLGIQFAISTTVTTMLDHAISRLRGEGSHRSINALPGGGWYVSLPLEEG